jgi:ribosomal protein S18 acetylase RimI-like enzyme
MEAIEPKTKEDFQRYYDLRWRILRKPWDQPVGSEKDELENQSIHIMVCQDDRKPIGVGRVHLNTPTEAQIRYMAVEEGFRSKGTGSIILKELEIRIKKKGAKYVTLNARESAVKFYERNGYHVVEKTHTLFGSIPHYKMEKRL